jgi:tetratricopeptide (TPR) repeat protein
MKTIRTFIVVPALIQCLSSWAATTNNPSCYEQGVKSVNSREWDKTIKQFSQAIELNPTNGLAFDYRGGAYFIKGDFDRAISDFHQAIRINSTDIDAAFDLASVYRAKGEFDKSISSWDEYMRLNPTNDVAYKNRASVYSATGRYNEAIKDWNEGLRLNPEDSTALAMRACAYFKTSQFDKADHDAIEAVRLGPTNGAALNNLAWFRATCPVASFRNSKEAVEAANKACELAKWTRWEWVDTLAAAFAEAGNFEKAVSYEKKAMSMDGVSENDRKKMQSSLLLYERQQPNHEGQK